MAEYFREVIREHLFEDELRALIGDEVAADEFVEAAEFLLARNPEVGTRLAPGSAVWFLPMAPIAGASVSLYYTFDDNAVTLLSIGRF